MIQSEIILCVSVSQLVSHMVPSLKWPPAFQEVCVEVWKLYIHGIFLQGLMDEHPLEFLNFWVDLVEDCWTDLLSNCSSQNLFQYCSFQNLILGYSFQNILQDCSFHNLLRDCLCQLFSPPSSTFITLYCQWLDNPLGPVQSHAWIYLFNNLIYLFVTEKHQLHACSL